MNTIIHWIVSALAVILAAYVLPGVHVTGFVAALIAALVLGLINAFIKPVLKVMTLPLNILTLGLFTLVLNALLVMLAAKIVPGFTIDGFLWAVIFAVVLAIVSAVLHMFGTHDDSRV